jgi:hypothetical protein
VQGAFDVEAIGDDGVEDGPADLAIVVRLGRDIERPGACRLLGKRLAEWVAVFCDGKKDQHPLNKSDVRLPPG